MLGMRAVRRLRQTLLFPWSILIVLFTLTGCERSSPPQSQDEAPSAPSAREAVVTPSDPSKPNIIFILVDALRADKVGAYHIKDGLTPTIDAIADEGVVFERAIAQAPWTLPSVASMFSSCNPSVHRVFSYRQDRSIAYGGPHKVVVFDEQFQTLAPQPGLWLTRSCWPSTVSGRGSTTSTRRLQTRRTLCRVMW